MTIFQFFCASQDSLYIKMKPRVALRGWYNLVVVLMKMLFHRFHTDMVFFTCVCPHMCHFSHYPSHTLLIYIPYLQNIFFSGDDFVTIPWFIPVLIYLLYCISFPWICNWNERKFLKKVGVILPNLIQSPMQSSVVS